MNKEFTVAKESQHVSMAPHGRTYSVAPHGQYVRSGDKPATEGKSSASSSDAGSKISEIFSKWASDAA